MSCVLNPARRMCCFDKAMLTCLLGPVLLRDCIAHAGRRDRVLGRNKGVVLVLHIFYRPAVLQKASWKEGRPAPISPLQLLSLQSSIHMPAITSMDSFQNPVSHRNLPFLPTCRVQGTFAYTFGSVLEHRLLDRESPSYAMVHVREFLQGLE